MLFSATGAYALIVGLASVFVLVLLLQKQRGGKEVSLWLFSGLVGILLGAAGAMGLVTCLGFELHRVLPTFDYSDAEIGEMEEPGMTADSGSGPGGSGMDGRFGGRREIPAKRQLTTWVRKLELLTGDIALTVSDDQGAVICEMLSEVAAAETMTDEEARQKHEALLGVLNEEQTAKQEKIRLPRSSGGGGGPGGMGGGEEEDEDANPFKQAPNSAAAAALTQRLSGKKALSAEETTAEKAGP